MKEKLALAKKNKKDEFYTQLTDIEKELNHYKEHFKNKIVFCNCDDPKESNFFKYFALNFKYLQLKKLVATHYNEGGKSYKLEIVEDINKDGRINLDDAITTPLKGNGDFRSDECIKILEESDIVVTNPPFSLFREYIAQLIEYNKKFVVIGHQNAISYKEIFQLIKENKIWLGYGFKGSAGHFINKFYEDYASASDRKEGMIRVSGVHWFTNLEIKKRHEDLILYKKYNEEIYPKYDNFDAINIDVTKEIPMDYNGYMGVPITFMDKYNPDQFEIIALGIVGSIDFTCNKKMEIINKQGELTGKYTFNAKGTLYKKYNPKIDKTPSFKDCETGELYKSIYARIIIKNKRI
ncbi:modification methylase [Aliarcobacter skirrowii]|uniref:Modification methylase n=1 Tax=Aliarcobacter skirrowii TaxID=28200 RepID=A0A2U2BZA9_9BACT|nr:adenine-specific methyltransferase EcoRI family protein [Aliarcobacter skirrowii]PWE20207.1 modification methylase [Aliarcobacter skirrowii]